ncbi:uncharacterized protein CLUP02_05280 [Colletotrichum lupini]|uniref:Uncharacterized protein n=1 Tax=Colletotrichum lupini TaxID=145971 RepID=A0A9Q8SMB3_9PEZI|nr:uncharacterized protein CLUP02_05280 [Colletotrichum lupini]UQC79800.1 hypothetical protein CLUP02_05280 [Colletotrichum lupini]
MYIRLTHIQPSPWGSQKVTPHDGDGFDGGAAAFNLRFGEDPTGEVRERVSRKPIPSRHSSLSRSLFSLEFSRGPQVSVGCNNPPIISSLPPYQVQPAHAPSFCVSCLAEHWLVRLTQLRPSQRFPISKFFQLVTTTSLYSQKLFAEPLLPRQRTKLLLPNR